MQTTKVKGSNTKHKVFLYTLSTCGWCKKTKEILKEKQVAYEYIDLDTCSKEDQKAAIDVLKTKNIPVAFPVIIVNDNTIIQGFKKDDILEAIK
ncbi:MAG: glutaredoxin family protein [Candidatus Bathyarchaeota archaeon]|nr:glutaredoxin family protein [Candidatus Bathyarchaeota archaeon]